MFPAPRDAGSLLGAAVAILGMAVAPFDVALADPLLPAPTNEVAVHTNGGVNFVFEDPCSVPLSTGQTPLQVSCESGSAGGDFEGIGDAGAGAGSIGVFAGSDAGSVDTTAYYADGYAFAQMTDSFAIRGPANASATLAGSFVLVGALDSQVGGSPQVITVALGSYSFQGNLSGAATASRSGQWLLSTTGADQQSNVAGAIMPVTSSFQFGSDGWAVFSISMLASAAAQGQARPYLPCSTCTVVPGHFSAVADFGNTIYWSGIASITVNGVELESYDYLASASGVDYRGPTFPVPEPASGWLPGSGIVALIGLRRRAR